MRFLVEKQILSRMPEKVDKLKLSQGQDKRVKLTSEQYQIWNSKFINICEDLNIDHLVYDKDGYYNPTPLLGRLLDKPINKLTKDEITYLYIIHMSKMSNGYYSNGKPSIYWYLGNYDYDFNKAVEIVKEEKGDEINKAYEHFSRLQFPLKVYRALRKNEDTPSGKEHSLSWTTDINIYKKDNSIFKNCDKIVEAEITADMIQNEWTIVNYIFYSAKPSYDRYAESEITLKPRYKVDKLKNLQLINKCNVNEKLRKVCEEE